MHERKNLDPKLNDDETMTRFSFFLITLYKILISYMISFAIQFIDNAACIKKIACYH